MRLGRGGPPRRRMAATGGDVRGGSGFWRGGRRLWTYVTPGGALGSRGASGVVGRWGERAALQGPGDGGNGGVEARWRAEGEKDGA
jgi:hypothetical protein